MARESLSRERVANFIAIKISHVNQYTNRVGTNQKPNSPVGTFTREKAIEQEM